MEIGNFLQIMSACIGVMGSIFFSQGVIRQSISIMASVSSTYFDHNPHMVTAMASQKAEYLFGGGLIVLAFSTQLLSFLMPIEIEVFSSEQSRFIPWIAVLCTLFCFVLLKALSKTLTRFYENQIRSELNRRDEEN